MLLPFRGMQPPGVQLLNVEVDGFQKMQASLQISYQDAEYDLYLAPKS